jgi:hypothetical protein
MDTQVLTTSASARMAEPWWPPGLALRALDLAEGEIAQAREHVETAKAKTLEGMTPRAAPTVPPVRRTATPLEPRNALEEAAWRGNFGAAAPVRTASTNSDGTVSKAEATARAAAEELARLQAAAEKRDRRRARQTRAARATTGTLPLRLPVS